uniref:Uncharacterized protein n=1 Tax=Cacopsylla melanoneura TaxID=428564 RepID=A0A8D8LGS8_9HEMI
MNLLTKTSDEKTSKKHKFVKKKSNGEPETEGRKFRNRRRRRSRFYTPGQTASAVRQRDDIFSGTTTTVKFSGTTTQKRESLVVVFHGWKTGLFHVVSSCFREEEGFFFSKSTTDEFILNTLSR